MYMLPSLALVAAWLAPNHYPPWYSFHGEMLALLALPLCIPSGRSHQQAGVTADLCRPAGFLVAIAAIPIAQWLIGLYAHIGDVVVSTTLISCAAVSVAIGAAQARHGPCGKETPMWLWGSVVGAGLLSSIVGVLQWLDLEGWLGTLAVDAPPGARAQGNLGQPNQLASLLLMGLVAWRLLQSHRSCHRWVDISVVSLLTVALIAAQSRAGMASAVLLTLFMVWRAPQAQRRHAAKVWASWLALFLAGAVLLDTVSGYLGVPSTRGSLLAVSDRVVLWSVALAGLAESPWWGYGWNQTPAANWVGALVVPANTHFVYAHNLVLDLMLWVGVPLGLMLSAVLGWWFWTRALLVKGPLGVHAYAMLIPLAFHSLVEFPFAYAYFLVTAGLMVGIVEAEVAPGQGWRVSVNAVRAFAGVALIALLYGAYEYLKIESDYRALRFENMRIGTPQLDYQPPDIYVLTHLGDKLRALRVQPRPDMPADELALLRDTSNRFVHGPLKLRYALALALNGEPLKAQLALLQLKNTHSDKYYQGVRELWAQRTEQYPQLRFAPPP